MKVGSFITSLYGGLEEFCDRHDEGNFLSCKYNKDFDERVSVITPKIIVYHQTTTNHVWFITSKVESIGSIIQIIYEQNNIF